MDPKLYEPFVETTKSQDGKPDIIKEDPARSEGSPRLFRQSYARAALNVIDPLGTMISHSSPWLAELAFQYQKISITPVSDLEPVA